MESIKFPESNIALGEDQPEYQTLYVLHEPEKPGVPMTACYKFTDEEIAEFVKTGKLYVSQLTFGKKFQPIMISLLKPF